MSALPDAVLWKRIVYELFTMREIADRQAEEVREAAMIRKEREDRRIARQAAQLPWYHRTLNDDQKV